MTKESSLILVAAILRRLWEVDYNVAVEVEGSDYVWRQSLLSCKNPTARIYINSYVKWPFIFDNLLGMEAGLGFVWKLSREEK